ncbi:Histone deacetylase [Bertholletia excelsa]
MEFWGVEVKSGEPCPVKPGDGRIVHVSQACLGAFRKDKGSESVYLNVTIGGRKLVLGTLSTEKFPQLQFDLVFDKNFELSHNWKNGSVYFYGYKCDNPFNETDDQTEAKSDDDLPVMAAEFEKPKAEAKQEKIPAAENTTTAKPESAVEKHKVKIVEPKKGLKTVEDDGSSEERSDSDSSGSDGSDDSDSDESDDSESEGAKAETEDEDETPKKAEPSKKRPAEPANKGPGPDKKAKLVTPKKTGADTKKVVAHVATPHPAKQAGKTPANQPKQQTPKSAGSHPCKLCNRSFNSENALQSHSKAKHSAGK